MKENIFGDYAPKESEDTAADYLSGGKDTAAYTTFVNTLPKTEIDNLQPLLKLHESYAKKVQKRPGKFEQGNIILGADEKEYSPSLEELELAEIGSRIKEIIAKTPRAELKKYLAGAKQIAIISFTFRHADVMGSGRFFYASEPKKEIISFA